MIVSGADYAFRKYTKNFILSLVNKGGIDIKRFRYFIFDFSNKRHIYDRNCRLMMDYIRNFNLDINTTIISFEEMQGIASSLKKFDIFKPRFLDKICAMDFVKARIFKYVKQPYLWIDSDIIVCGKVKNFYKNCKIKNRLAMAIDTSLFSYYFDYYSVYAKKGLHKDLRIKGTLNAGVLYIPKDYSSLWYDVYSKTTFYDLKPVYAQGVWNVIFWLGKGRFIPKKYNFIFSEKEDSCMDENALVHFAGPDAKKYYEDYVARQNNR